MNSRRSSRRWFVAAIALLASAGVFACGGGDAAAPPADPQLQLGQMVYKARCVSCHGPSGLGAVGPKLGAGAVVAKYPNAADERAVVADGRNGMPRWSSILSADEIDAVVRFTRESLGR